MSERELVVRVDHTANEWMFVSIEDAAGLPIQMGEWVEVSSGFYEMRIRLAK